MGNPDELIREYLDSVLEVNKYLNLTRIESYEKALVLHVEDSLVALPEMNDAPEGLCGDLGSGGGFPGVPLAIATGRKTILVDSVKKKMAAVSGIVEKMGLSEQISTYDGRIEDLGKEMRGQFSVLTARALTQLPSLLELASPLLAKGGRLICYKAQIKDEEIDAALALEDMLGLKMMSRRSLTLSDGETYREIIVFEKTHKAKVKLPRRVGLAQKEPLSFRPR